MKKSSNPGDYVAIKTKTSKEKGTLLESHEPGFLLLKLDSGYNIGIKKKDIVSVRVIKKAESKEEEKEKTRRQKIPENKLPNVAMIITGGTISSRLDPETGAVKWLSSPEDLFKIAPKIKNICNIIKIERPFMMASENMSAKEWIKIAKLTQKISNDSNISGVIITHGTDFLHYTASALSFFLRGLGKPVVLTYSQRSSDRGSSDAALNLICSAKAAVSDIAEVMLVGHASMNDDFCYAMPGTKTRKMHSSRRDTFKCINAKPFAKIFPDSEKIEKISDYKKRTNKKTRLDAVFESKVALVKFYPGQSPDIIDYYAKNYKGIIVEASGLGFMPTKEAKHNWLPALKKAIAGGLVVCAALQTLYGRLDPLVYSPGRELLKTGIIYLEDMLPETAFVKLGWTLAHKDIKTKEQIKQMMLKNFAHELNPHLGGEFLD